MKEAAGREEGSGTHKREMERNAERATGSGTSGGRCHASELQTNGSLAQQHSNFVFLLFFFVFFSPFMSQHSKNTATEAAHAALLAVCAASHPVARQHQTGWSSDGTNGSESLQ